MRLDLAGQGFRETNKSGLCARIGREIFPRPGRAAPGQVDDASLPASKHGGHRRSAKLHRREEVELHRRFPRTPVAFPDLANGPLHGGVVHQDLDPTPALHLLDHGLQTGLAAQIRTNRVEDLTGCRRQRLAQPVQFLRIASHHDQAGALAPEETGDLQPQPACAASDKALSPSQAHGYARSRTHGLSCRNCKVRSMPCLMVSFGAQPSRRILPQSRRMNGLSPIQPRSPPA